jgi:serine/arginine repetitive matrix protein 2
MAYPASRGLSSSPDPLNDTPTFSSPAKPIRQTRSRKSLLLPGSSPTKQTFELDVGTQISPQKIKVTVEAGNSKKENTYGRYAGDESMSPTPYYAPPARRQTRTTTTTIPVKGLSDTEDDTAELSDAPKRRRGRPRKSVGTPVPAKPKTRNVTPGKNPARKTRKSIGDLVDGDDEEDWDFAIGNGVEIGRGKGRSRSRSVKSVTRNKATSATKKAALPDKSAASTAGKKGRRKTLTSEDLQGLEDEIEDNQIPENAEIYMEVRRSVLGDVDLNTVSSSSAFSTIRSTTTVASDGSDILLGNFGLDKTPQQPGWSSPRIVSVLPSRTRESLQNHPKSSPLIQTATTPALDVHNDSQSLEATNSASEQFHGQSDMHQSCDRTASHHDVPHEYGDEANDHLADMPEFDTILESEGFSMISVDSVPSLREHLSSPPLQPNPSETPMILKNKHLAVKSSNSQLHDSFSSIPETILDEASPIKRNATQNLLSVPKTRRAYLDDSFSSVAPQIMKAATPKAQNNRLAFVKSQAKEPGNDSFSSVPDAILEAATPAKFRKSSNPGQANLSFAEGNSTIGNSMVLVPTEISMVSLGHRRVSSMSSRMLTPEETPSPPQGFAGLAYETIQEPENVPDETHEASIHNSSNISVVRSSPPVAPPRYTYTAHLRQHRALNPGLSHTPSIVFSSPALPALRQRQITQDEKASTRAGSVPIAKPELMSSVRAGRALQDIVIPSSNSLRSSLLRSPFKSPNVRRNSTSVEELPNQQVRTELNALNNQSEKNPSAASQSLVVDQACTAGEQQNKFSTVCKIVTPQNEDPFAEDGSRQLRSPSPEDKENYTLEVPAPPNSAVGNTSMVNESIPRSENEMSWQAEYPVVQNHDTTSPLTSNDSRAISFVNQQDQEDIWAEEWQGGSRQIRSASTSPIVVINSDPLKDDSDDEDIWAAEARHSSSVLRERDREEEQVQSLQQTPQEEPAPGDKPRRSKIPSPWRKNSKRLVYSDELAEPSSPTHQKKSESTLFVRPAIPPPTPLGAHHARVATAREESVLDESMEMSAMWKIPQKMNFAPKPRQRDAAGLDLSALLASSPAKISVDGSLFGTSRRSSVGSCEGEEIWKKWPSELVEEQKKSQRGDDEPSPKDYDDEAMEEEEELEKESYLSHSQSDHDVTPTSSPIQQNYGIFANRPSLTPSAHQKPYGQPSVFNSHNTYVSPLKSCLHTPSASPTKRVLFSATTTEDDTTQLTLSSTVSTSQSESPEHSAYSPPIPQSPAPSPLSSTTWSKAHWKLLQAIYRDYKAYPPSAADLAHADRNARQSEFVGKTIYSRGEELTLKAWHMEVVRLFREEVEGWEEGVVAKRVFALVIGERVKEREGRVEEKVKKGWGLF